MFFSRVQLRSDAGDKLAERLVADGYRLHQTLWKLFEGVEQRDFLFRRIERAGTAACYLVSKREPRDQDSIWQVQSKPYHPRLGVGQQLLFSLHANPVVSRRSTKTGRASRHDVLMDARKQRPDQKLHEIVQPVGERWLEKRAGQYGFAIRKLRVDGYRQNRLQSRAREPIRFSTLEFDGLLEVREPEKFWHCLRHGIGPAKSFGCGLMLIRRA